MTTAESALAESIDALVDVARLAGIDPGTARDEGLRVAAALAESVPGAAHEWAAVALPAVTDLATINEAFFDAASRGRRWRHSPTDLLVSLAASDHDLTGDYAEALTEIASDAVMLGTAPIWVIANATAASATYLAAANRAPAPRRPIDRPTRRHGLLDRAPAAATGRRHRRRPARVGLCANSRPRGNGRAEREPAQRHTACWGTRCATGELGRGTCRGSRGDGARRAGEVGRGAAR